MLNQAWVEPGSSCCGHGQGSNVCGGPKLVVEQWHGLVDASVCWLGLAVRAVVTLGQLAVGHAEEWRVVLWGLCREALVYSYSIQASPHFTAGGRTLNCTQSAAFQVCFKRNM